MTDSQFPAKGALLEGVEAGGAGNAHDVSFRLAGGVREMLERSG